MIVLDASAGVELLLTTEGLGAQVRARLLDSAEHVHVPHLFDIEVTSVIRRLERTAAITNRRATQALGVLRDLPLVRYPHWPLQTRVWRLRSNLTPYDAIYVALAEALDGVLLTTDRKLKRVPGACARVEVVG